MADTKTQTPPAVEATDKKVKPEKPSEEEYQASLKKAEKEHADSMARFNAIRAKLDLAKPTSKDSPTAKRRADLISQLKEIREKQSAGKSGRKELFDKIAKLDASIKTDIANQKTARGKVNYKSVEDLDREIKRLEDQVNRGDMKIVDEKKALAEVSNLRKQRKGFSGFDDAEKAIATKKAEVKKLRDTLDDPESKALSDKYNTLQSELDKIKAEQDDAFKSINTLRDERTKLQNEQQEKYLAIKTLKDNYYHQNKAVQKWEFESRQRQRERRKQEQDEYVKGKKKERAQQLLSEASDKAYLDEIRRAEAVLRYLDPSFTSEKAPLQAASKFSITNQRTVDDAGIKGTKVASKKDNEEDFFAAKPKTGKKGKKSSTPAEPAAGKYTLPPSVLEDCNTLGVEPPLSSAEVPSTIEKVKAKLEHWKSDQAAQTERNIAKAKKEVERLDAEDSEANTPAPGTPHANGDGKATAGVDDGGNVKNEIELTQSAEADAVADLKAASLEDKE